MKKSWKFSLVVLLCPIIFGATNAPAQLLNPSTLTKYVDPLPQPPVQVQDGWYNGVPRYDVHIRQAKQKMHAQLDSTTLFTYDGSFPGPSFHILANQPFYVRYYNDLPQNHMFHIDTTTPLMAGTGWGQSSRSVTHLHGADIPPEYDGHPLSFIYPGQQALYRYPNAQNAMTLWYSDHAAGISGQNVYAGEAGFWVINDAYERNLNMPSGDYELEIMIADRTFYQNGQLFYPAAWSPHFFGNVAVVNGKVWPIQQVDPRKYRIHVLNGCNERYLSMKLLTADSAGKVAPDSAPGPAFYMVGTDQGLVQNTIVLNQPGNTASPRLLMGPGERRDVIIDFTNHQGEYFLMHNNAPAPFEGSFPENPPNPLPQLWLVHVRSQTDGSSLPMHPRTVRRYEERTARLTRDVSLREVRGPLGNPTTELLNDRSFFDSISEYPQRYTTEVWRYINATRDEHPMQLPLVNFQILDRRPFNVDTFLIDRTLVFTGPPVPPAEQELGLRDVVDAPPGYVTRVVTSPFNRLGEFVYNCGLLSCGDNQMMRPLQVTLTGGGPQAAEIAEMPPSLFLATGLPEPFRGRTSISYGVPYEQLVNLRLYNAAGQEVRNLASGMVKAGPQSVTWDGTDDFGSRVPAGAYFCKMQTACGSLTRRVTLLR